MNIHQNSNGEFENDDEQQNDDKLFESKLHGMAGNLDEIKQLIKKIEIFNHLNEELEEIASKFTIETFNIGEIIIQQEEQANNWFIIIEGTAIILQKPSPDEPEIEISKLGPIEYFGLRGLQFNQLHAATVKANEPLKCVKMSGKDFESHIRPIINVLKEQADLFNSWIHSNI